MAQTDGFRIVLKGWRVVAAQQLGLIRIANPDSSPLLLLVSLASDSGPSEASRSAGLSNPIRVPIGHVYRSWWAFISLVLPGPPNGKEIRRRARGTSAQHSYFCSRSPAIRCSAPCIPKRRCFINLMALDALGALVNSAPLLDCRAMLNSDMMDVRPETRCENAFCALATPRNYKHGAQGQ